MVSVVTQMLQMFGLLLGVILAPFLLALLVVVGMFIFNVVKLHMSGIRRKKAIYKPNKEGKCRRIFGQLPKQLAIDFMNKDPDDFMEYGLHMYCGPQGSGKTIAVTKRLMDLKDRYPKSIIRTNMAYRYEDESLQTWEQMVDNTNGKYGQIEVLDEIQNWFNSNDSRNFPAEMLTEISQQRKQRKMLIGTAQVYSRIAKPIREQVTFVYLPRTYLGCLTIVKKTRPEYWNNDKMRFTQHDGRYFFVHNEKIRDAYDTYRKIRRYKKVGFQERKEDSEIVVNVNEV